MSAPLARLLEEIGDDAEPLRRVLRPLLRRMASPEPLPAAWEGSPAPCPNCGGPISNPKTPYCGDHCKEMAAYVRQFRAALTSGAISDPERQANFGQNLWHLRTGGYPGRQAMIPARVQAQVIARAGGGCAFCPHPAVSVTHIGSG